MAKIFRGLKHQESSAWCFWSLNDIKISTTDDVTGWKRVSQKKLIYLEVKMKEAKFNWCVYSLESKKQKVTNLFAR